ncbi:unnamed protein product [Pocillopora meandrina]|uniref:Uncharacterized protein n=1 Tax=Pocillopora meandrina TaxID=46732 RepID=A0AAU9XTH8_9CNID|nr:unnamed protein product [Pocillopora meandrina]
MADADVLDFKRLLSYHHWCFAWYSFLNLLDIKKVSVQQKWINTRCCATGCTPHIRCRYYPCLPVVRSRGDYCLDDTTPNICAKRSTRHPSLLPGVFLVHCKHGTIML